MKEEKNSEVEALHRIAKKNSKQGGKTQNSISNFFNHSILGAFMLFILFFILSMFFYWLIFASGNGDDNSIPCGQDNDCLDSSFKHPLDQ